MAKIKANEQQKVAAYLQTLEPPMQECIILLREIILASDAAIAEQLKWNSASFYYTGRH